MISTLKSKTKTGVQTEPTAPEASAPGAVPKRKRAGRKVGAAPVCPSKTNAREAAARQARIETILARLEARYGVAEWVARLGPVDELVACILSQHTSDLNSGRAFDRLKAAYADWQSVVDAPVKELADTIRSGGLANSKAPRIQGVLRVLKEQQGAYSLDCLAAMTDPEARAYLMALPGVGPKTAAIVLSFALNRPVIPVDTHIFRVSWRLGLIDRKIGEARAHDALQAQVPSDLVYRFHVAIITHGRQVCKAPTPRCSECPLTDVCRYYHDMRTENRIVLQTEAPQEESRRAEPKTSGTARRTKTQPPAQNAVQISSEAHDAPL